MKAIVREKYGSPDVLELKEVEKPSPNEDQVLVRVHAVSINAADWHILRGPLLGRLMVGGLLRPKHRILGSDIAGRVEAVGANVKEFQPGDQVFGAVGRGGFAEYVVAPERSLVLKPANVSFEEAAAAPVAAVTALQGLRDEGQVQPGQKVLINGGSGGVGTFAVQLAKVLGAEVTAVCSTRNLEMARSLGADHVVDYTQEDVTMKGERFDVILDNVGNFPASGYNRVLKPGGAGVVIGFSGVLRLVKLMVLAPWVSRRGRQKIGTMLARLTKEDLTFLRGLLESGKVKPVIDRRFRLPEVAEAFRYFGRGHSQGKVIIAVGQ